MSEPMHDDLLAELIGLCEQETEQPGDVTIQSFAAARHISDTAASEWLNRRVKDGLLVRVVVVRTSKQKGFAYRRPAKS